MFGQFYCHLKLVFTKFMLLGHLKMIHCTAFFLATEGDLMGFFHLALYSLPGSRMPWQVPLLCSYQTCIT